MCASPISNDIGELRLGIQSAPLLPHFEGKVLRVTVKNGAAYCEVTAPHDEPTICKLTLNNGDVRYQLIISDQSLGDILISCGKDYLKLDQGATDRQCLSKADLAKLLGIRDATKLDLFLPTLVDGRPYLPHEYLNSASQILKRAIPQVIKLGPEAISDECVILGNRKVFNLNDGSVPEGEISVPIIESGFLKFPLSDPAFQISSKGAYECEKDIILSIDHEGMVTKIDVTEKKAPKATEVGVLSFPECDAFDITGFSGILNGTVFYVSILHNGEDKLLAFDKDSLEPLGSITGVKGPIFCDDAGNVLFVDDAQSLRIVSSNVSSLSGKKIVPRSSGRAKAIEGALAALDSFSFPAENSDGHLQTTQPKSGEALALKEVQDGLLLKIRPSIDECKTLEDIVSVEARVGSFRSKPEFSQLPSAFELVDLALQDKKETLAYPELERRIAFIKDALAQDEQNLPDIRSQFHSLAQIRSSVVLKDQKKRSIIGESIQELSDKVQALSEEADNQAKAQIEEGIGELTKAISTCATQEEVLAVVMEGEGKGIRKLIGEISDSELRDGLNEELTERVNGRIKELAEKLQKDKLRRADESLKVREEYLALVKIFQDLLAEVKDRKGLQEQANSPLMRSIGRQIEKLPEEEREEAHTALNRMLAERGKVVDFSQRVNDLSKTKGFVRFGEVEFPRAGEFEILFEPKFVPVRGRSGFIELVWRDSRGKEFRPEVSPVSAQADETEKSKLISDTKEGAGRFFMTIVPRPPTVRSNWVINKHFEMYLGELAELLNHQRKLHQGLVIVEGDAGAAKSALVQMFCALTNRPMNTFACNGQTEKEDLTYLYQYDPEKGTYRLDSGFIEALQTPNALVLLEEINSLPVPVAKMLNTLFDYRRELYLPDGRVIKADPSVLVVGLQNPQSYAGVNKLSKEFLSRALVMEMDYAKHKEGARFLPYEAEMYSKYRPALADLTQDEFYAAWGKVVNSEESETSKRVLDAEREREIKGLKRLIDVANSARDAYRAYQREESLEPFEFIFSYREAEVIATLWDGASPIDRVIARVVLPKIPDAVEKKAMGALIGNY